MKKDRVLLFCGNRYAKVKLANEQKQVACLVNRLNEYEQWLRGSRGHMSDYCGLCQVVDPLFTLSSCMTCVLQDCSSGSEVRADTVSMYRSEIVSDGELRDVRRWKTKLARKANWTLMRTGSPLRVLKEDGVWKYTAYVYPEYRGCGLRAMWFWLYKLLR